MTLQKIEFEYDIPDGYRFVRYGKPKKGNSCLADCGQIIVAECDYDLDWIIVERIPQNTNRHKHADLIHAWADGSEIQLLLFNNAWGDCHPDWREDNQYRIKPKTKTVRFRNYIDNENEVHVHHENERLYTFKKWIGGWKEVEVDE